MIGFFAADYVVKARKDRLHKAQIAEILDLSGARNIKNWRTQVDFLRGHVHDNSVHMIDEAFYKLWRDQTLIAGAVLSYIKKKNPEPPHLECSTRSGLLSSLYKALGYKTRAVQIWKNNGDFSSHVYLEIQNPQTGAWEIQDPDHNVTWKNRRTGKRVPTSALIADFKAHHPCDAGGCGWRYMEKNKKRAVGLKPYDRMASIIDKSIDRRITFYGPDTKPETVYTFDGKTGTFCDVIGKNCKDGFIPVSAYKEVK